MLFKKLLSAARSPVSPSTGAHPDYPLEIEAHVSRLHARAPVRRHLDTLFGELTIGEERYTDLYFRCLEETGTVVTPFNVFQRFQTRHDLVRYFLATLPVTGAKVECGAYRGATALLLCRVWRSIRPEFSGQAFYLLDSFSGTSASTEADFIPVRDDAGHTRMEPFFPPGKSDVNVGDVRARFREFPEVQIVEGWIPDAFRKLPEQPWSFVHLDLTLYEATLTALEYFYEKLAPGGVMICDGSVFCPGAQKAVDAFARARNVPYVTLGHREAVFLKP